MSIFDEYTIAYRDRGDLSSARDVERMIGTAVLAVIVIDGRLAGSWRRIFKNGRAEITLNPFRKLTAAEQSAVKQAAKRYGDFINMPVTIQ